MFLKSFILRSMAQASNSSVDVSVEVTVPKLSDFKICFCGKTLNSNKTYIKNDYGICSLKCLEKSFEDVETIPSNVSFDRTTHAICKCGVIYPKTLKFEIYQKQCCSPDCISKIRAELEPLESKKDSDFSKPDVGGGFAF